MIAPDADLVRRLREHLMPICHEAAARIEALTKELENWQEQPVAWIAQDMIEWLARRRENDEPGCATAYSHKEAFSEQAVYPCVPVYAAPPLDAADAQPLYDTPEHEAEDRAIWEAAKTQSAELAKLVDHASADHGGERRHRRRHARGDEAMTAPTLRERLIALADNECTPGHHREAILAAAAMALEEAAKECEANNISRVDPPLAGYEHQMNSAYRLCANKVRALHQHVE